ncbi:MAG: HEAT repeat domain-containing protein [Synechococcus sp.]|nr:HEAT repeat domain-containing protein [Synechococcus sp.]
MGQKSTTLTENAQQPSLSEFLRLCATSDLSQAPRASTWGLQLLEAGTFQERWRLTKVFPKLGEAAILPLLAIAEDNTADVELRWFAIRILGQYRNPEAIARLILLLDRCPEEYLLNEIVDTLVQLEAQAVDYLAPLLGKSETCSLAVQALCKLRYPQIVEPLLTVVDIEESSLRCLMIETLSQFRQPSILPVLLAALKDPVAQVRCEAAKGLGFWGQTVDPEFLCRQVQPLLYDINLAVCEQAGFTLSRFATPQAAEAIAQVLASPHTPEALQISLIQALGWLELPESITYLESFLYHESTTIVTATLKALGRFTQSDCRHRSTLILLKFWEMIPHPQPLPLQQTFIYALGQLADPRATEILNTLSQSLEKTIHLHAIAALKKISAPETPTSADFCKSIG